MIRSRLLAAAAFVTLAAGAASAQAPTSRATTPMAPVSPQSPTAPVAAPPAAGTAAVAPQPTAPSTGAEANAAPAAKPFMPVTAGADLASTLKSSGQFTTLLKAADATGLTPVLATPGLTVFAPTDAAFAALPPGKLDELMKQENLPQLQKLLTYHVVNAKIPDFKGRAASVTTAAGSKLYLDATGAAVKVNDATALQPAVVAGTSTIYPIDKVIMPDFTPPPAPAAEPEAAPAATTTKATTTKSSTKTTRKPR